MNDPIVDEVWRVREAHAARFNYDLDAIYRDIKEQEKRSGLKYVSYAPANSESNQTRTSDEAVQESGSKSKTRTVFVEVGLEQRERGDEAPLDTKAIRAEGL
jgi:hypothetical protein